MPVFFTSVLLVKTSLKDNLRIGVYSFLISLWIILRTTQDVLGGCAGWFCSLTDEAEVGAGMSSQGLRCGL